MFDHLLGNPVAKEYLSRLAAKKKVPPVLLLHGPEGVGKGLFAEAFAKAVIHPSKVDLYSLRPEGKTFQHSVASVRALIEEVNLPPFQASCKFFILHDAEKMGPAGSNALLKTLEEPPSYVHFILTTSRLYDLLPTVISRCQKIPFFPVAEEEIIKLVGDSHIAILSEGSISKALFLSKDSKGSLVESLFKAKTYADFMHALSFIEEADEEEDKVTHANRFFEEVLFYIRTHFPLQLEKSLPLIHRCRQAIFHHVKLKTTLEIFFLN